MTASTASWKDALIGQTVGHYRLDRYLGGGAFSYVYEGADIRSDEAVAIKVLNPNAGPDDVAEFETEAHLLQALVRSSSVVTYVESAQESATVIFSGGFQVPLRINMMVLELASACMDELLAHRNELLWIERLLLWRGVVLGIHQMHLKRMVHRDLKASNCLLFVEGGSKTSAKVADLGRGKQLDTRQRFEEQTYSIGRGDPRFAAPEFLWLQGKTDDASHMAADLYGLGSVLFELGTGVGLTQIAVGPGRDVMRANMSAHMAGEAMDLSVLTSQYDPAWNLFESEVPSVIRAEARALLAQLCDPRPDYRWPQRLGKRARRPDGLLWLLRRTDILIARLKTEHATGTRYRKRGRAA
jgi:serine/threonine protein kinase